MKKSSKGLALIGLAVIVVGISGLFQTTDKINKNIKIQEIKAYNHSTENALDNVFMQDDNLILPFIFDNISQADTLDIRAKFAKANMTIKNLSTETVGTGTQVTVNENNNTYNILIYGDVNGDGKINLIDAQKVILHYLDSTTNTLTGLDATAANVNNKDNNEINLIDAQRIILFYLGNLNTGLVVEEPEALNPEEPIEDSISNITIIKPTKLTYIVGEELDLTGGKIIITYVSGKTEIIDMQANMISGYDKYTTGRQTVEVSYIIDDIIKTDFFEVIVNAESILDKEITKIIISGPDLSEVTCNKPVNFTLTSGENEKNIDIKDLKFEITYSNDSNDSKVAQVSNGKILIDREEVATIETHVENGKIKVIFIGEVAGKYIIIPSVNLGKIKGAPIEINVIKDVIDDEEKTITLYASVPEDNKDIIKQDDDGYIYTLIPIDEIGISEVEVKDILYKMYEDQESKKIEIIDNVIFKYIYQSESPIDDEPPFPSIVINVYDENMDEIKYRPTASVSYIGIALENGADEEVTSGDGYIVVKYKDREEIITIFNINVK